MCFRNMCSGLHFLPIGLLLVSLTTFCLTYIVSVLRKDVNPVLPYIRYIKHKMFALHEFAFTLVSCGYLKLFFLFTLATRERPPTRVVCLVSSSTFLPYWVSVINLVIYTCTITYHTMIRWCSAFDQFPIIYERNIKYLVVY